MRDSKREYFKAFFGVGQKSVKKTVVVSPIIYPKQFEKLYGKQAKHYRSKLGYLIANFSAVTFIKTPMTQAAVFDISVLLRNTKAEEVVFIGAMGGLENQLKIGDILLTNQAKDIHSVSSMHDETEKKLKFWKKKGKLGIDFELKAFFRAMRKIKKRALAALVVTDLPLKKPFYKKKTKVENEKIKAAVQYIVQSV